MLPIYCPVIYGYNQLYISKSIPRVFSAEWNNAGVRTLGQSKLRFSIARVIVLKRDLVALHIEIAPI